MIAMMGAVLITGLGTDKIHNVDFFPPPHGGASTNCPGTGHIALTRASPTLPLSL